jgi:hypothetical protein
LQSYPGYGSLGRVRIAIPNHGPPAPGAKQLGQFYELESSSPALALAPGQTAVHVHQTLHLEGSEAELDPITRQCLGVSLEEIKRAFSR